MKYELCSVTDVGSKRDNNEDGFYINDICCYNTSKCFVYKIVDAPIIALVADGVGGTDAGEEATRLCVQLAHENPIPYDDDELIVLLDKMNKGILELRKTCDTACTIAGIILGEDSSYSFNLCDSKVYSLEKGFLNQISTDDTVSGLSGETTDVKEPLMQYLGKEFVLPHINIINHLSTYLICTDGLTDMISLDEIEKVLVEENEIKDIATILVGQAKKNGGLDNISLIIIKPIKEECNNG